MAREKEQHQWNGQRLAIFQITLALSIKFRCIFFSRNILNVHTACMRDGRKNWWWIKLPNLVDLILLAKLIVSVCGRRSKQPRDPSKQFLSTYTRLVPLRRYFLRSGPEYNSGQKTVFWDGGKSEGTRNDWIHGAGRKPSSECPKNTQFSSSREQQGWGAEKLKKKKRNPDGNCNNIALDQTSTHPTKWWFGIFPLAANGVRTIAFLADFKRNRRRQKGDGDFWLNSRSSWMWWMSRRAKIEGGKIAKAKLFICPVVEFHFLSADQ